MQTMKGIRAVVTGGSSGIGYDVARRLQEAGAEVVITGQDEERLHGAAKAVRARALPLTLHDAASVARFFQELGHGQVDIFLANAGSVERTADAQAAQTTGALRVVSQAAQRVVPRGMLAVTNTLFTQFPDEQVPAEFKAYVHGKRQITACASEVRTAHPSLRVLDIALGFVDGTRGLERIKTPEEAAAYTRYIASVTPGGKLTTPGEAGAFIFDQLRRTSGGVRVGIDGSVVPLAELAMSAHRSSGSSN